MESAESELGDAHERDDIGITIGRIRKGGQQTDGASRVAVIHRADQMQSRQISWRFGRAGRYRHRDAPIFQRGVSIIVEQVEMAASRVQPGALFVGHAQAHLR